MYADFGGLFWFLHKLHILNKKIHVRIIIEENWRIWADRYLITYNELFVYDILGSVNKLFDLAFEKQKIHFWSKSYLNELN